MSIKITSVLDPGDANPWPLEYHPTHFATREAASLHFMREARYSQEYADGDVLTISTADDSWRVIVSGH